MRFERQQIFIAYNLILTCRWYVKFDVNVFSNIKTNIAILHYKTDIAYTCCKQLACTVLQCIYLSLAILGYTRKRLNRQFQSVLNLA